MAGSAWSWARDEALDLRLEKGLPQWLDRLPEWWEPPHSLKQRPPLGQMCFEAIWKMLK